MVLLTLDVIALMCSSNVKDVSNIRPKCFCHEACWTRLSLNYKSNWKWKSNSYPAGI